MAEFSWYTIPKRMTELETVYQYAVDRFIPYRIDKRGFGSYIHIKKGTFVVYEDGGWKMYKPNLKGGHRHNHIYNVCNRILFRSKNARQIDPTQKQECRKTFEIQVFGELKRIAQINFLDILKKGKSARITKKRRSNGNY